MKSRYLASMDGVNYKMSRDAHKAAKAAGPGAVGFKVNGTRKGILARMFKLGFKVKDVDK